MAVDIVAVCSAAQEHQSSQTLAIVLAVMFSLYTVVAITLSALTIYSTSAHPEVPTATATAFPAGASAACAGDSGVDVSLVGLRPTHLR